MRLIYALIAAGTALSNSTAETVLSSFELPAYSLQRSQVYHVSGSVLATATNSTDTLRVDVRVGPVTLTGTIVATAAAADAADNNVVIYDLWFTVRNTGATSVVIVHGFIGAVAAEGTATMRAAFHSLSLDSSVAQKIEVTGTWSVASASNSCRADSMLVRQGA